MMAKQKKSISPFTRNFAESLGISTGKRRSKYESTRTLDRAGYVYVLHFRDDMYKIGRARDPQDRLRTFEVKLPFPVEFELLIQSDDMYALERELHRQFAPQRINGEWFKLSPDDIDAIRKRQQQVLGDDE